MIYYPFQWNRYIIRRCPQKCLKSGYTETGSRQVKWSNWRIESVDVRKKIVRRLRFTLGARGFFVPKKGPLGRQGASVYIFP